MDKSDPDDKNLASQIKSRLATYVQAEFGIDLEITQISTGSDEISLKRRDAFFLCRGLLIRQKIANYAEQFEGLYAMLRGLSLAFGIGTLYLAGWGCSSFTSTYAKEVALAIASVGCAGVLIMSLFAAFGRKKASADLWLLGFLLVAAFGLGMRFGIVRSIGANYRSDMWIGAFAALVACTRCYSGYRKFAMHFAQTVWRDFVTLKSQPQGPSGKDTA